MVGLFAFFVESGSSFIQIYLFRAAEGHNLTNERNNSKYSVQTAQNIKYEQSVDNFDKQKF